MDDEGPSALGALGEVSKGSSDVETVLQMRLVILREPDVST